MTATLDVAVDTSPPAAPCAPAPAQPTCQATVTRTGNRPPATPAEDRVNTTPQVGDAAAGSSTPGRNGLPGPAHDTVPPTPKSQVTVCGLAVAVTDTPGTAAVADTAPHTPPSHSHTGTPTSCGTPSPGDIATSGVGNRNLCTASRATAAGDGAAPAVSGSHTTSKSAGPHDLEYQDPRTPGVTSSAATAADGTKSVAAS